MNDPLIQKGSMTEPPESSDDLFNRARDIITKASSRTPTVTPSGSRSVSAEPSRRKPTKPFEDYEEERDPTASTKMMDSGGATQDILGESIDEKRPTPSRPPDAQLTDSDVPQDLQNQRAIDNNATVGSNPYRILEKQMKEMEELERRATAEGWKYYGKEAEMLAKNHPIFEGGGGDVAGEGRGSLKDLEYMEEQKEPADFNVQNPKSMGSKPSQARDGSIDPTLQGVPLTDYDVGRNASNSGMNEEGMTPSERRENRERDAENTRRINEMGG